VTTREPRYTDQDRAELLALAEYRAGLCAVCGGPAAECQSHELTGPKFRPLHLVCRRRDALSIAQADLEVERPEAIAWFTTTERRR
jgi:hypothetical protein